jgi:hypothetical protein
LIGSAEGSLRTDFAILNACQPNAMGEPDEPMAFATSRPGHVDLMCGTKFAEVAVRLEAYDSAPPEPLGYEDCDELPWRDVVESPVQAAGFNFDAPVASLDLRDVDATRVRVCASGRYRYEYGHGESGLPPESWLLQFWPDRDGTDEVDRRPRRLGGRPSFWPEQSSTWLAAMHAWKRAGWPTLLGSIRSLNWVRSPLFTERRPLRAEQLSVGGDTAGALPPHDAEKLAQAFGAVDSWGSLIDAMHRVGLIAMIPTADGPAFVPNPAPLPAWTVVDMDDDQRQALKRRTQFDMYRTVVPDIEQLVRWSPSPFTAAPRMIAVRLAMPVDDVVETLRLVETTDPGRVQGNVDNVDTPVTIS